MTPIQSRYPASPAFQADRHLAAIAAMAVPADRDVHRDVHPNKPEFVGVASGAQPPAAPIDWPRIFPGL